MTLRWRSIYFLDLFFKSSTKKKKKTLQTFLLNTYFFEYKQVKLWATAAEIREMSGKGRMDVIVWMINEFWAWIPVIATRQTSQSPDPQWERCALFNLTVCPPKFIDLDVSPLCIPPPETPIPAALTSPQPAARAGFTPSAFWCGCCVCSPAPAVCSLPFNNRPLAKSLTLTGLQRHCLHFTPGRWETCGLVHTSPSHRSHNLQRLQAPAGLESGCDPHTCI